MWRAPRLSLALYHCRVLFMPLAFFCSAYIRWELIPLLVCLVSIYIAHCFSLRWVCARCNTMCGVAFTLELDVSVRLVCVLYVFLFVTSGGLLVQENVSWHRHGLLLVLACAYPWIAQVALIRVCISILGTLGEFKVVWPLFPRARSIVADTLCLISTQFRCACSAWGAVLFLDQCALFV